MGGLFAGRGAWLRARVHYAVRGYAPSADFCAFAALLREFGSWTGGGSWLTAGGGSEPGAVPGVVVESLSFGWWGGSGEKACSAILHELILAKANARGNGEENTGRPVSLRISGGGT